MAETDAGGGASHSHSHSGRPVADDATVPWRFFLSIGLLVTVIAAIYWFTAYEDAGTVLLLLSAVLALWCGVFLWLQWRRPHPSPVGPGGAAALTYLPHASVWPFAIGLGAALIFNGLVLGIWVIFPGALLLAFGLVGFIRQSRRRD